MKSIDSIDFIAKAEALAYPEATAKVAIRSFSAAYSPIR
jgi:hypothetical protein